MSVHVTFLHLCRQNKYDILDMSSKSHSHPHKHQTSFKKFCSTHTVSKSDILARINRNAQNKAEAQLANSTQTLYVDVRYVCLYQNEGQRVSLTRIQENHRVLNSVYSGQNSSELSKVPNTTLNPWQPVIGNPRIQFLPLDASQVTCEYKPITSALDGNEPVVDAAIRGGRVNGVLNIYISTTSGGSILGQAELASNIVYVLYTTVGGPNVPGTLTGFNTGKTLVHEVGHSLDLNHTFYDTVCDGVKPYPDVPEAVNPSYDTELYQNGEGKWDLRNDNRDRDRRGVTSGESCLNIDNKTNDMGCNIMDYGDDEVSLMFSASQASIMRNFLLSGSNTALQLKTSSSASYSESGATSGPTIGTSAGTTPTTPESDSDSSMSTTTVVIIVCSVLGALIIGAIIFNVVRHKQDQSKSSKKSEAYTEAQPSTL